MKDQIQFETNGLTVLAVPVGEHYYDFKMQESVYLYPGEFVLTYKSPVIWDKYQKESWIWSTKGNWKYHCTTSVMTEEQAKVLAQRSDRHPEYELYQDAMQESTRWAYLLKDPIYAVRQILRSHGIDPNEKRVLLIKSKK